MPMPKPIPIAAAERICKAHAADQVIIYARTVGEGGGEHVTTYGKDKANCEAAARIGDFIGRGVVGPMEELLARATRAEAERDAAVPAGGVEGDMTQLDVLAWFDDRRNGDARLPAEGQAAAAKLVASGYLRWEDDGEVVYATLTEKGHASLSPTPPPVVEAGAVPQEDLPDKDGMDGTERLCRALYGRKATARDYLGGSGARMLHDAADRLSGSNDEGPVRAVSDDGKRWRIIPADGDWEMQPVGRISAGQAEALCKQIVYALAKPATEPAGDALAQADRWHEIGKQLAETNSWLFAEIDRLNAELRAALAASPATSAARGGVHEEASP